MDSAHSSGLGGSAEASSNFESNGNSSGQPGKDDNKQNEESSRFECNICLDIAKDAVVSMCGHLFCWPCLHQWIDTRPNRPLCPVCKSSISKDKVIPLYGRGGNDTDPREKCPPRPRGQRTEDTSPGFPGGFNWGGENGHGGVQFSLGIGVFPISFFASFFNGVGIGGGAGADRRAEPPSTGSRQHSEEQFLSNVFMYIGILFVLWLVFF